PKCWSFRRLSDCSSYERRSIISHPRRVHVNHRRNELQSPVCNTENSDQNHQLSETNRLLLELTEILARLLKATKEKKGKKTPRQKCLAPESNSKFCGKKITEADLENTSIWTPRARKITREQQEKTLPHQLPWQAQQTQQNSQGKKRRVRIRTHNPIG
uniref:Uncharacterized protein n=1 Tax=Oryza brachyantha TaxID=4533 RepID=J3NF82_ORYBR